MGEIREELLASIKASKDVKKVFTALTMGMDKYTRDFIQAVYDSKEIRSHYDALRAAASLDKSSKNHRELLKIPNGVILQFLDDLFTPTYGSEWLTDRKILHKVMRREDLIKPWIINKP